MRFGTEMPFDAEGGLGFVRDTIASIERMNLDDDTKHNIYEGDARRMLRLRAVM